MTSKEINAGLAAIEYCQNGEGKVTLKPTNQTSSYKTIPFHGFYWRDINFDKQLWVAASPYLWDDGQPLKQWIGFCVLPFYGYDRWLLSVEESAKVRELCEKLVAEQTLENIDALYDYMQTLDRDSFSLDSTNNTKPTVVFEFNTT